MDYCPHCSNGNIKIAHTGICPKIKAIEYYRDGSIKRLVFKTPSDHMQPLVVKTWPPPQKWLPTYTYDSSGTWPSPYEYEITSGDFGI